MRDRQVILCIRGIKGKKCGHADLERCINNKYPPEYHLHHTWNSSITVIHARNIYAVCQLGEGEGNENGCESFGMGVTAMRVLQDG